MTIGRLFAGIAGIVVGVVIVTNMVSADPAIETPTMDQVSIDTRHEVGIAQEACSLKGLQAYVSGDKITAATIEAAEQGGSSVTLVPCK